MVRLLGGYACIACIASGQSRRRQGSNGCFDIRIEEEKPMLYRSSELTPCVGDSEHQCGANRPLAGREMERYDELSAGRGNG